jgi:hypothetical protein
MPRMTPERAGSSRARIASVSSGAKAGATLRRKNWEKNNPQRFETPEIPQEAVSRARQATQSFEEYLSGKDISDKISQHNYGEMLGGRKVWGSIDRDTLKSETGKRFEETRGAAQSFGEPGVRWENFSPEKQTSVLNKLRQYGVTPDSAHHAFSAQVSQSVARGMRHGTVPYASGFYHERGQREDGSDTPRSQIERTSKDFGVGFHVAAAAHALLSPQLPFEQGTTQVNDDAARHALGLAKSGIPLENIRSENLTHLHPNARPAQKMRGTVHVLRQLISGVPLHEAKSIRGEDPFGPKTGPYLHAFLDPNSLHHSHLVADTHTAYGFTPHLTTQEKDKLLQHDGVHAFFDHIGHKVMHSLGLPNIHWTQASQWGEQRIGQTQISEQNAYKTNRAVKPDSNQPLVSEKFTNPPKSLRRPSREQLI